jgi:hypothetical protein
MLDRFLVAFADSEAGDDARNKAALERLSRHRIFSRMLPRYPQPESPLERFLYWRIKLWQAWAAPSERQSHSPGLAFPSRQDKITFLLSEYGGYALATQASGEPPENYAKRLLETRKRLEKKGDGRIGLKPDGFLQSLRRALEISHRMRRCAMPDCQRLFLAKRSSDKFCCKFCGAWGKRESKRQSWRKNWKHWPSTRWRTKGRRKEYLRKEK